ncbi:helicase-exonuclease AddAB subunit AddA [Clostridium sp. AF18-27]|uniref:helicase-exonuclease AddAB subunit AddA n=1 Tax=Enterocloster lavalensis TaxID=460384 RepID=UPI000E51D0FF|nr:helicase-exonuclease AddAB subunit AddA [Enterocloster lavalensis]RHR47372.1 helicase-exonuclease AddAB subunit AddA [Clostridium sp. AF18-27]
MAVKWTEKQQQVIDSRNRNLLVSAAAGSGKTAVLVERIIRMISEGEHPLNIDQLLVMTFTNAAAAEMRERVGAAVDKLLTVCPDDEHLWLQGALIPQAQITTIDSFCLNLIRNHYSSLEIDPAFRIGDEGELALMRADVMKEMLERHYQEGGEDFAAFVEQFGRGKSDAGIEDVILQAWQFSQSHPWPMEWVAACREELREETLEQIEQSPWMQFILRDVQLQMEELEIQLGEAIDICREENGPLAYEPMLVNDRRQIRAVREAAGKGNYRGLYEELGNISFGRLAAIRSKEVDQEKKAYVSACRDRAKKAVAKCQENYGVQSPEEMVEAVRGTAGVISTLLDLTEDFDRCYREKKRDRNVLDFNDLEHLALEVLMEPVPGEEAVNTKEPAAEPSRRVPFRPVKRRPTAVADELARQFEEILVDEYQDSNNVQETLITSISRERWGKPNVFMVGDVKQSIYRFRLARPELFMDKYERYSVSESLHQKIELHQNFRSRATVLDSVNDVFYKIMTRALGGIRYTEETALHPGAQFAPGERTGTPTELLLVDTGADALKQLDEEAMDYTAKELEARMAAIRIRELMDPENGLMVWDKGAEEYRPVRLGDMVILLRSLSGWSEVFVNVLMNEGIPAYAQTKTGYFNTVEVETVLSLLAVVDNPMQDIPLAAVMRSPMVSMTDEEMAWLVAAYKRAPEKGQDRGVYGAFMHWKENGGEGVDAPEEAVRSIGEKLACLETLLEGLRRDARYLPVHQLLYRAFEASGYYDYVSAMPAGETRRANLDMLVEKAIAYEATSYKGLFHFIRYIEKLKKYDTDFGEANVAGEQADTVRIMSIHKSKGLEFPVVFLAGMGKRFNKQDAYGAVLLDADLGLAADYLDLKQRLKMPTLKKQALKRRMELESMGEELRVLYVAMTRAKEKLIMTATDRSLGSKLEKWAQVPLADGAIPYTILSAAGSFLDWLLMSACDGTIQKRQIPLTGLVGMEIRRQASRQVSREELLTLDTDTVYDPEAAGQLADALNYRYPYGGDTGLYAMLSVSELKKQGQVGQDEEEIGRGRLLGIEGEARILGDVWTDGVGEVGSERSGTAGGRAVGSERTGAAGGREVGSERAGAAGGGEAGLERAGTVDGREVGLERAGTVGGRAVGLERAGAAGAARGTAYHRALECLDFGKLHSREDVRAALKSLLETGYLEQEAYDALDEMVIFTMLNSPLGQRMAEAQRGGRLHREQQFIIGIPAREMGRGDSRELVLVQGVIDAYMEEEDGLVLIDYKTDRVPGGRAGRERLAERYRQQVAYYQRALEQLTGKKVKENIIYSLTLQESVLL